MKLLIVLCLLGLVLSTGCDSSSEAPAFNQSVSIGTPKNVGDVKVLDDVYKKAFEEAKATITYETANAQLDTIENEIQKELSEVGQ